MTDSPLPANYYAHTAPVVTDWGKMIAFTPSVYFTPTSLDQLQIFLTDVLNDPTPGKSLRFLGGLHSCSHIFDSDIVVDTSRLPLEFTVTPGPDGTAAVVASAYMHAHDFLARAAEYKVSLTALGGTDAQTLAGLISTNTAGATVTNSVYQTLDWVEYLTVSDDGKSIVSRRVAKTDPAFQAVVCSLGAMGFLTRVGFTLVPERFFEAKFYMRKVADVLGDVAKTCAENEFWRIEWLPGDLAHGLFWCANQVAGGPRNPAGDYPVDGTEHILTWIEKKDEQWLGSGPFSNEILIGIYEVIVLTYTATTNNGPMRNMIPCDRLAPMSVAMAEWSFNPADLTRAMDVCRAYFGAHKWPNLPVEIECTRTDSYMMSPWNWTGLPYIIKFNFQYLTDFLSEADKAAVITHLRGLWAAFDAAGVAFKAHWGKINFLTPDSVADRYQAAAFMPYVQPMFLNESLKSKLIG